VALRDRPVGRQAATPNEHRQEGRQRPHGPRRVPSPSGNDPKRKPSPIPLENCPWCGTAKFDAKSFASTERRDPRACRSAASTAIACSPARQGRPSLPIVAVDEPLYRGCRASSSPRSTSSRPALGRRDGQAARQGRRTTSTASMGPRDPARTASAARPLLPPGSDHPGRAAPDLRPARHDGRPLRDRHRRAQRRIDGKRSAPRSSPRPRRCAAPSAQIGPSSAATRRRRCSRRPGPIRRDSLLRPHRERPKKQRPPLPRHRRAGALAQGRAAAHLPRAALGGEEALGRPNGGAEPR
jgi:hypothetical protein